MSDPYKTAVIIRTMINKLEEAEKRMNDAIREVIGIRIDIATQCKVFDEQIGHDRPETTCPHWMSGEEGTAIGKVLIGWRKWQKENPE